MTTQQDVPPDSWPGAAGRVSPDPGHPPAAAAETAPSGWPGAQPAPTGPAHTALPEPTQTVDPKAKQMWAVSAALGGLFLNGILVAIAYLWFPPVYWAAGVGMMATIIEVIVMPPMRYRIHRWDLNHSALLYRHGWITHHLNVVPVNRIQTVESEYGPIARLFGLGEVKIATAAAAADISIEGLPKATVERLVAQLTTMAGLDDSDAT